MFLQRRNPRLRHYDYSSSGAYFITICTSGRQPLFGRITDGVLQKTPLGEIVEKEPSGIPSRYSNILLDTYTVMPNHIHAVIVILSTDNDTACPLLGNIIRAFKAGVSRQYGNNIWQRGYHDHVIRNSDDLREIREYVANNPIKWDMDMHNPVNPKFKRWNEPET